MIKVIQTLLISCFLLACLPSCTEDAYAYRRLRNRSHARGDPEDWSGGGTPFSNATSALFDGVAGQIDVPDHASLNMTTNLSVSFWIKSNGTWNANDTVIAKWLRNSQNSWRVFIRNSTSFAFYTALTITDSGGTYRQFNPASFSASAWHHMCVVYDGGLAAADRVTWYVNGSDQGTLAGAGTVPASLAAATSNVTFGSDDNNTLFYGGNLDEIGIFNTSLTSGQVSSIYNSGVPASLSGMAGLVGYWRFDGDVLSTIVDHSSNSNDGTASVSGLTLEADVP